MMQNGRRPRELVELTDVLLGPFEEPLLYVLQQKRIQYQAEALGKTTSVAAPHPDRAGCLHNNVIWNPMPLQALDTTLPAKQTPGTVKPHTGPPPGGPRVGPLCFSEKWRQGTGAEHLAMSTHCTSSAI
eukprot:CAMPEP_0204249914 /NCGR_PEP_ID=MMETSP0361-20130328/99902_1 /ASSEMBLY_ACC=CAM_ASM_000343 /TAXON_ID=268821 /ORGANISM="Scrippsiella Hangoei, Strain SHTV-5" /LENGTH=128 /DNA_ID=CAMNT_0051223183 /DNA_START=24 /DNA_END=409 /DNA_ORIENTATION=+